MQFTDLLFLFVFLPALLIGYYVVRPGYRNIVLIVFSLFFYACGSPGFFLLLMMMLMADVGMAGLIVSFRETKKPLAGVVLAAGIMMNLGVLGYYKYSDFAAANINRFLGTALPAKNLMLPLGLSFFTFKAISLLADAYKRKWEKMDVLQAVAYLSFFGQIQSGPIARYQDFDRGVGDVCDSASGSDIGRHQDGVFGGTGGFGMSGRFSGGVVRFMTGFSKKVLLADVLSNVTIEIFDQTASLSMPLAWLGAICYSLQLYYDFSGYSDMAVGICQMLGLHCPENFNYPYMTGSISEFWRRWHITLGAWFRDYVYIPMGGSRAGRMRLYANLFVVWILTGIWHGAGWSFIVWGVGYFLAIAAEKTLDLPGRCRSRILKNGYRLLALLFIVVQWVIFRSNSLKLGIAYLASMFGRGTPAASSVSRAAFLFRDYGLFLVIAFLFAVPVVPAIEKLCRKKKKVSAAYDVASAAVILAAFIIALSFVVSGQNSPFLYGNF